MIEQTHILFVGVDLHKTRLLFFCSSSLSGSAMLFIAGIIYVTKALYIYFLLYPKGKKRSSFLF